jgi:hypothetical protein
MKKRHADWFFGAGRTLLAVRACRSNYLFESTVTRRNGRRAGYGLPGTLGRCVGAHLCGHNPRPQFFRQPFPNGATFLQGFGVHCYCGSVPASDRVSVPGLVQFDIDVAFV